MTWRVGSFVVWGVLALWVVALEVLAWRGRAGVGRPGPLLLRLFRVPWGRAVLLVGWMWLGWHLFAR